MVFVLKPLTQSQQIGNDVQEDYKHRSRLVICGNFASWGEHSTTTTNLDAPLLRLMLSLACSADTTWSSIDITSAFLNADIHDDDTVSVTPPPILVKMDIVKPNTVWHVKKAIYGLREAPRLWQQERDQKLRDLEFMYKDKLADLVQSHIHPSLWFIAEGPRVFTPSIPPFDHSLRRDEWTARLHDHQILGYAGVYVGDLLIAGPRSLNSLIKALSYALRYFPIPPQSKNKLWVLGDASFAPTGEKGQQGVVVHHGITSNQRKVGNLVQWRSSRQDQIAKSTCEAELIASSEALLGDRFLSSAGTGKHCALSMKAPNPSPVLDKNRAPIGPQILSSTGAGVWRKAPKGFRDSSSVLEKFQSAIFSKERTFQL